VTALTPELLAALKDDAQAATCWICDRPPSIHGPAAPFGKHEAEPVAQVAADVLLALVEAAERATLVPANASNLIDAFRLQVERRCLYHRESQLTVGEVQDRNEMRRDLASKSEASARQDLVFALAHGEAVAKRFNLVHAEAIATLERERDEARAEVERLRRMAVYAQHRTNCGALAEPFPAACSCGFASATRVLS